MAERTGSKEYRKRIEEHLAAADGIITNAWCRENGVPTVYLGRLVVGGALKRIARGVYRAPGGDYDEFWLFQRRYARTVFSRDTAAFLLDAADRVPTVLDVAVPASYKFREKPENVRVRYVRDEIWDLGIRTAPTAFGNLVRVHSYERILCDLVADRRGVDREFYVRLAVEYPRYEGRNEDELLRIATVMGVERTIREDMELVFG